MLAAIWLLPFSRLQFEFDGFFRLFVRMWICLMIPILSESDRLHCNFHGACSQINCSLLRQPFLSWQLYDLSVNLACWLTTMLRA